MCLEQSQRTSRSNNYSFVANVEKERHKRILQQMGFGILGRSDGGRPAIEKLHDEGHTEAPDEEQHNAIEEQAGDEEDDAQADEALEELLPADALRFVHHFLVAPLR